MDLGARGGVLKLDLGLASRHCDGLFHEVFKGQLTIKLCQLDNVGFTWRYNPDVGTYYTFLRVVTDGASVFFGLELFLLLKSSPHNDSLTALLITQFVFYLDLCCRA